ncbi:MAG: hypothetical protein ACOCXA_07375 [Planctomycetota bacterium]
MGCLLGALSVAPASEFVEGGRHEAGVVIDSISLPVYTDQTDLHARYSMRFGTPDEGIVPRGLENDLYRIPRIAVQAGWTWRGFDDIIREESGNGPSGMVDGIFTSEAIPIHLRGTASFVDAEIDDRQDMSRLTFGGEAGMWLGDELLLFGSFTQDSYEYDLFFINQARFLEYDINDYGAHGRLLMPVEGNYHQVQANARYFTLDSPNVSYDWYEVSASYDYYPALTGNMGVTARVVLSEDNPEIEGGQVGYRVEAYPGYTAIVRGTIEYFFPFDSDTNDGYVARLAWTFTF